VLPRLPAARFLSRLHATNAAHRCSDALDSLTDEPTDQPALAHFAAVALGSQERKAAPGWAAVAVVMAGGGTCTKGRVVLHLAWKRGSFPLLSSQDLAASHAAPGARYV